MSNFTGYRCELYQGVQVVAYYTKGIRCTLYVPAFSDISAAQLYQRLKQHGRLPPTAVRVIHLSARAQGVLSLGAI